MKCSSGSRILVDEVHATTGFVDSKGRDGERLRKIGCGMIAQASEGSFGAIRLEPRLTALGRSATLLCSGPDMNRSA